MAADVEFAIVQLPLADGPTPRNYRRVFPNETVKTLARPAGHLRDRVASVPKDSEPFAPSRKRGAMLPDGLPRATRSRGERVRARQDSNLRPPA